MQNVCVRIALMTLGDVAASTAALVFPSISSTSGNCEALCDVMAFKDGVYP